MKYRLYVDEVGNSDLGASHDPNHRYLSLTGVILELGYVESTVYPSLEAFKRRYFESHPDDPIPLHRKELVNKRPPFECLRDPTIEESFNVELLALLTSLDYTIMTVVIDKLEHLQRYTTWRHDPYHYCLAVLVERYVYWLHRREAVGDVMAESRGGREDRRLKEEFARIHREGTEYLKPDLIAAVLTSRQLKVKAKTNNIAGLQLADLMAHPSYRAGLARRHGLPLPDTFGGLIAAILEASKYDRSPEGRIDGWGMKWLP